MKERDTQLQDLDTIALEMVDGSKSRLRKARRRARRINNPPRSPRPGDAARRHILEAANNYLARSTVAKTLTRRHIQAAVCIARRRLLVSDETLRAAGFKGVTPRPQRRLEHGRGWVDAPAALGSDFVGRPRPKR